MPLTYRVGESYNIMLGQERAGEGERSMLVKTSDLRLREVVNVLDGKRMGFIGDLEIEAETGQIMAIVVPGQGKFLGFLGRSDDVVIPWERIKKIGLDVILVEVSHFTDPKHVGRTPA